MASEIPIPEDLLLRLIGTLENVYSYSLSYDLFNQYKNLSSKVQKSPMTRDVELLIEELNVYTQTEEDVPE